MKLYLVPANDAELTRILEVKEVPAAEILQDGERFFWYELAKPDECWFREVRLLPLSSVVQ